MSFVREVISLLAKHPSRMEIHCYPKYLGSRLKEVYEAEQSLRLRILQG